MEKLVINNLVSQIMSVLFDSETLPIKSSLDYSWQDFAVVSDMDADDLATSGVGAKGTLYESGVVQLTVTIRPKKTNENLKRTYERLKAKNLVLVSIERAGDAKRAGDESIALLKEAANMLGITTQQALELVNKSEMVNK